MREEDLPPLRILRIVMLLGLSSLSPAAVGALRAEPRSADVIFQSSELRIYRALDQRGSPTVVLTNLDEQGNRLSPGTERPPCVGSDHPAEEDRAAPTGQAAAEGPGLRVIVHGAEGADPPGGAGNVEITGEGQGGTTVVININNLPPSPPAPAQEPQAFYPVLAVGGLAGPFRYPDHQYFLGYGPGIGSPSLFGGLGLNAGNRFGLKTGRSCGQGYDCLFAP